MDMHTHPEIRQDRPDTSPKCGMTLEPVPPSLEDEANPELAEFTRRVRWTLPLTVVVTASAMSPSSGSVIGNALRLRRAASKQD